MSGPTRTSNESFDELHALTADYLIATLKAAKAGRLVHLEGGEYVTLNLPPAYMAQAIKFLKDNGIDQPAQKGNRVDTLKNEMPDFGNDNVVPFAR